MKDNKTLRGFFVFSMLVMVAIFIAFQMLGQQEQPEELTYTKFLEEVKELKIEKLNIVETKVFGLYKDSEIEAEDFPNRYDFFVNITNADGLQDELKAIATQFPENAGKSPDEITSSDFDYEVTYDTEITEPSWLIQFLPFFLLIVLLFFGFRLFMKQVEGTNNKQMSFGKSKARVVDPSKQKVTFADVAGADEEKEELREIVEFLKSPKKFIDMGARIPKGVLLMGPPGTGKTLLARAVAGEAGVPFLTISGSDFVEMYVGVGASRVRDLFAQAKKSAPSIIFIDEIDAVGRHRGSGMGGGHDEREQTLNQLLVEMDGFSVNEGIIVVAATNRQDILDTALLRPGRFDRRITVTYPDVKGRKEVLEVHSKGKPLADDVDLEIIARLTPFSTGADLENILNESAILAARANEKTISMKKITEAIDRVAMGPEKKSRKVIERDVKLVAYHETGHALVAYYLENCDPVHLVTIIPRGAAGGYTQTVPSEESYYVTRSKLEDKIAMTFGGYVAEELTFGDITTGSSSDLKSATATARRMITEFGMSENIGPIFLASERELMIGREIGHTNSYSEELAAQVDVEISRLLEKSKDKAEKVLRENSDNLKMIAEILIEKEKMTGEQFRALLEGKSVEDVFVEIEEPEDDKKETEEKANENKDTVAETSKSDKVKNTDDEEVPH